MISLKGRALVVLLFFYSTVLCAAPFDQEWLALLRYNKFSDSYVSEADAAAFFLHKKGKYDPALEYNQLILELKKPVTGDDHPACLFPARTLKLLRDGAISFAPNLSKCTKLQQYLRGTNAKSASLVFAGYFIQKPASAFGHTFLRLHTNQQGNAALLDFAVDFAASVDTSNPIAYGVKGIIGGFAGKFSRMPYFLKLREYADLESRDVWEYPLNLSKDQTTLLVLHLWEMDRVYFDYYYFSENCSYHILRAIEAISGKDISAELKFFVTPLDTIHALNDVALLGEPKRRPSQHAILTSSLNQLEEKNKKIAHRFLIDPLAFTEPLPRDAKTLDTFIEILNYRFAEELLTDRPRTEVATLRKNILTLRSTAGEFTSPILIDAENPASSHRGSWLSVNYVSANRPSVQIDHAFALHHFSFPSAGFSNRFQMIMGRTTLEIIDEELRLNRFDIFDVLSASNSFSWDFKPSWNLALGLERSHYDVNRNLRTYTLMSSGVSLNLIPNLLFTLSLDAKPRHASDSKEKFKLPLGASSIMQLSYKRLRVGHQSSWYREVFSKTNEYSAAPYVRYSPSKSFDLEVKSNFLRGETLTQFGITAFY